MLDKKMFKKPKNKPEFLDSKTRVVPSVPDHMFFKCGKCRASLLTKELRDNLFVCPSCSSHYKITARERIASIVDENSFSELFSSLSSVNILDFPSYGEKLQKAKGESGENEGVITGTAKIGGYSVALFVMESGFMMGSMGSVVGEKITRLFEKAAAENLPVVGFICSGGARMQEGMFSLMQMAKTSGAVKLHSDKGLLYIAVLTDPTTGGVTASFAMQADITLSEPNALVGFAGPRVIEQTIRQKLPPDFQRAEFVLSKGFIDKIVSRTEQKTLLTKLLSLHKGGAQ